MAWKILSALTCEPAVQSSLIIPEAVKRMLQVSSKSRVLFLPATDKWIAVEEEDSSVFRVEKENLYIDTGREAILWSQVLRRLGLPERRDVVESLGAWARDSLKTILRHVMMQEDISFWLRPQCFVLVMQTLCAADVVLHWRREGITPALHHNEEDALVLLVRLAEAALQPGRFPIMLSNKANRVLIGHFHGVFSRKAAELRACGLEHS
jgi:hypothetical protein